MAQAAAIQIQPANDLRKSPRRRSLRSAKLTTADTRRSSDCTIRNLSVDGAKLSAPGSEPFPDGAWLIVSTEGLAMRTRTVWRHGREFGVSFVESCDLARNVPAHLAGLRLMWIDQLPR